MLQVYLGLRVVGAVVDAIPVTWLLGALTLAGVLQLGLVPGLQVDLLGMAVGLLAGAVGWVVGLIEAGVNWLINAVTGAVSPI